jgi:hypothetical protein
VGLSVGVGDPLNGGFGSDGRGVGLGRAAGVGSWSIESGPPPEPGEEIGGGLSKKELDEWAGRGGAAWVGSLSGFSTCSTQINRAVSPAMLVENAIARSPAAA